MPNRMRKTVRVYNSHMEAEKADREFYRSLSPSERLDTLLTLIARYQKAGKNETRTGLERVYRLLKAHEVRYLVVGAFALAFHGRPRYTGDIDFFVESSPENAKRIEQVLEEFGLANIGVDFADFTTPNQVVQLWVDPNRIDIMTSISDVTFVEAWSSRQEGELDGILVHFISKELLKRNKTAVGRKQDLADVDYL